MPADDPELDGYLSFFKVLLGRDFNPHKSIAVEMVNGLPAKESEYAATLRSFGFQESYNGLELWRRY